MLDTPFTWGWGQVAHADAEVHFEITNTGPIAAHNVYCALRLEEPRPVDLLHGHSAHYQIGIGDLSPTPETPYRFSLDVRANDPGSARVHYRCWCDEVPTVEGDIEFEVPPREAAPAWLASARQEPLPDYAIYKTWDRTLRVGEHATCHITATNRGGTALHVDLWDALPASMQYGSHTGTDVSGGTPLECMHDPIARIAICRYDIVRPGESATMDVTVVPTEAGDFTGTVYVQFFARPTDRGSQRVSEAFEVEVLT